MKRLVPALLLAPLLAACSRDPAPEPVSVATPPPAPDEAPAAPDAATPVAGANQVPRAFLCRGNEPFWSLDVGAGGGLLKTPESEVVLAGELRATDTGAYTFRGAPEDQPEAFTGAVISPGQCFDTMADGPAMPFSVLLSLADGGQGSGCCTAEYGLDLEAAPAFDPAGKPEGDWSREWPSLGASVLRCAYDGGVVTEAVVRAWPMNRGKAIVQLRDSSQSHFDCLIDIGSGDIESVQPGTPEPPPPGGVSPEWLPAGETRPVLHCGRVERVANADGLVIGWLHYREGCPAPASNDGA